MFIFIWGISPEDKLSNRNDILRIEYSKTLDDRKITRIPWIRELLYIARSSNSVETRNECVVARFSTPGRRVLRSSIKSPLSRNNYGREYRSCWINCKTAKIRPTYLPEMENGTPRHRSVSLDNASFRMDFQLAFYFR